MIRINQLKMPIEHTYDDLIKMAAKMLNKKASQIVKLEIVKRSLDARKKEDIKYIYAVDVITDNEEKTIKYAKSKDIVLSSKKVYSYKITGKALLKYRPVIVGSGPAGLFAAYNLAKCGFNPLVIERGESVDVRTASVEKFWQEGKLNTESNVQFGEGGAGTFSDGKLNTMVKDTYGRIQKVLETFVKFGAPSEILYINKPHIGTDNLKNVVKNMRNEIIRLGGEIWFNTRFEDFTEKDGFLSQITVIKEEKKLDLDCDALILAVGHSARDTFEMLNKKNISMEAKAFAVGVRIEHKQALIGKNQYGSMYEKLPAADYKLTYTTKKNRGVYSFCMCPGGYVVNASSEKEKLVVNGMSNYKRNGENANSAIVVTVNPKDFVAETNSNSVLNGMYFQRKYEELAYKCGRGNIPVQLFGDLIINQSSVTIGNIVPSIKGNYSLSNLRECLPPYVTDSIIEGVQHFDNIIKGFADKDAVLDGVEMRTSSPIRIKRDIDGNSSINGIYPCGEGAGYAGGITSAAVDGIKVFEALIKKYKGCKL